MSLNIYSPQIPLPAPLAAGAALQFYTDPDGDVWVAKGGVRGGGWRRALDVLRARVHRATAITAGVVNAFNWMPYDGVTWDEYGLITLNTGSPGCFKCPLAGFWRANSNTSTSTSGTGRALTTLFKNGAEAARGQDTTGPSLAYTTVVSDIIPLAVNDTLGSLVWVNVSTPCSAGAPYTFFTVEYHGSPIGS